MGFFFLSLFLGETNMKLFYQEPQPNAKKIHKCLSKGYGIKHPENISGYAGTFLFRVPDVYLSDKVANRLERNEKASEELMSMITRLHKNDYGFVTDFEQECNIETRYFSYSPSWMIGRYSSETFNGVILETLFDMTIIYYPEEDIADVLHKQIAKWCRNRGVPGNDLSCRRVNELRYVKD